MRRLPAYLLLAMVPWLLSACRYDPAGDEPMDPPSLYRTWWSRTESCSGLSGDFDRVRWQVVAGHSFQCPSGQCAGHWSSSHEIFLAQDWTMNEMVVRHEMLHELLQRGGHPTPPFGSGCPLTWATWPGDHNPPETQSQSIARTAPAPQIPID
ncbi:MAG: hypothetical protein H0W67_00300 [Gemmatimonadales bacterium]|nr:hypothetical protein [Gemmatimonadales bacterium]